MEKRMNQNDYEDYIIVFNEYSDDRERLEYFIKTNYPSLKIEDKFDEHDEENYYRIYFPIGTNRSNILYINKANRIAMFKYSTPVEVANWSMFSTAKVLTCNMAIWRSEMYLKGLDYLRKTN